MVCSRERERDDLRDDQGTGCNELPPVDRRPADLGPSSCELPYAQGSEKKETCRWEQVKNAVFEQKSEIEAASTDGVQRRAKQAVSAPISAHCRGTHTARRDVEWSMQLALGDGLALADAS
jgi:hypothetical protein